ncbi:MAG TPA: chemotaxis protein CheR [Selenomonas sp.]|nr:chemotaxis protein CheR [Selenomonas sp.]
MSPETFQGYAAIVAREFGIQLPPAKQALLESRLYRLLREDGPAAAYGTAENFLRALRQDATGRLLSILSEAITTHHTFFLREADHFAFYRDEVLPYLERTIRDGDIRTWCAACSTGQESYTLAMLLEDYFALRGSGWEKTLLATDLARDVLEFAREGIYPSPTVKDLPETWRRSYFHAVDAGHVQVVDAIRRQVLYRPFNLMTPTFPFRRPFHVIFCRNVMIYFDAPTRRQLVQKFVDFLEPGGFLFIGHSEVIDRQAAPFFAYVMPSVCRKRADA